MTKRARNFVSDSNKKINVKVKCPKQYKREPICKPKRKVNLPRKWSDLSYAGESRVPQGIDPTAGSWPLFFFKRNEKGQFIAPNGQLANFKIQNPDNYNFDAELSIVKETLDNLTPLQKQIAKYWGDGPATKQWTPIIDRLIDTYELSPVRAARVLAAVQGGMNDAFVIAWYYKYLWNVSRPNQLDQNLITLICTPKFPTYPSGHSVVAGTAEIILTYFFNPEACRLKELAEEASISRLYGGVHFPADLNEGLRLGRDIGQLIVRELKGQNDEYQSMIDYPFLVNRHADLPPPPFKQIIPFPPRYNKCDLPLLPE